jgi:hypothetical protein
MISCIKQNRYKGEFDDLKETKVSIKYPDF